MTADRRVAPGPVAGTDWCVLDDPPCGAIAPGGVVLCLAGTLDPSPDATRAAVSAWEELRRWRERTAAPA